MIVGLIFVQLFVDEFVKYFMQQYLKVLIEVQGGGLLVGIKFVIQGIVDIGILLRELIEDEVKQFFLKGWQEIKIVEDGIVVIVYKFNFVLNFIIDQIRDIFFGKIKNWKEVGGKDVKIVVVIREEGLGIRGVFEEIVMGKFVKIIDLVIVQLLIGVVKIIVLQDENVIGYILIGVLDSIIKGVKVEGIELIEKNVKFGKYKIKRLFLFLVFKNLSKVIKVFIDFVFFDEGQVIVVKNYIFVK